MRGHYPEFGEKKIAMSQLIMTIYKMSKIVVFISGVIECEVIYIYIYIYKKKKKMIEEV